MLLCRQSRHAHTMLLSIPATIFSASKGWSFKGFFHERNNLSHSSGACTLRPGDWTLLLWVSRHNSCRNLFGFGFRCATLHKAHMMYLTFLSCKMSFFFACTPHWLATHIHTLGLFCKHALLLRPGLMRGSLQQSCDLRSTLPVTSGWLMYMFCSSFSIRLVSGLWQKALLFYFHLINDMWQEVEIVMTKTKLPSCWAHQTLVLPCYLCSSEQTPRPSLMWSLISCRPDISINAFENVRHVPTCYVHAFAVLNGRLHGFSDNCSVFNLCNFVSTLVFSRWL